MNNPHYLIQSGAPQFRIIIERNGEEMCTLIRQDAPYAIEEVVTALHIMADELKKHPHTLRFK